MSAGIWISNLYLSSIISIFFLNDSKNTKYQLLAPIEVKILLCRGSAQKIAMESGTIFPENAKSFCSKILLLFISIQLLIYSFKFSNQTINLSLFFTDLFWS